MTGVTTRLKGSLRHVTFSVRRALPALGLGLALALGPLAAWATTKPDEAALIATFGAFWITASVFFYQLLRRRLPMASSVAVIAVLWGLLAMLSALSSHPCDVSTITQASCSTSEVANATLAAMVMPFIPLLLVLPFLATRGFYRGIARMTKKAGIWVRGKK